MRRPKPSQQPEQARRWIWPAVFTAAAILVLFAPIGGPRSAPAAHTIRLEASMFEFAPAELRVNPGDSVTIELVSTDVVHGLSLDGHNFELQADPGQTAVASFTAGSAGAYRFRCSVACGNMHPFMIGVLRVGPNLLLLRGIGLGLLAVMAAFWSVRRFPTPLSGPDSG